MLDWLASMFCRPKVTKLLEDEIYQAEREILGLREKTHRLKVSHAQAEVALDLACEYRDALLEQKKEIWSARGGLKQ